MSVSGAGSSGSTTVTVAAAPSQPVSSGDVIPYVLHLPASASQRQARKRVGWTEDVVDNEQLNKRKSKSQRPHSAALTREETTAASHTRTHAASGLCAVVSAAHRLIPLLSCVVSRCVLVGVRVLHIPQAARVRREQLRRQQRRRRQRQ